MTTQMVREKFGEPESVETGPGLLGDSCWRYVHEEQWWLPTLLPLAWPVGLVLAPIFAAVPAKRWDEMFVHWIPAFVHFKAEKLVYWELVGPVVTYYSPGEVKSNPFYGQQPNEPMLIYESGWYSELSFSEVTCQAVEKMRTLLPSMGDTGYVTQNQVTVWSAPTTSSQRKALLDRDQPVKLLERKDQWCHVEDDSGSDGWTKCRFIESKPQHP
jgi:hypothetical protein